MVRRKKEKCPNCNGENPKCHYLEKGGKACRKGKAIGKAVSEKTLDRLADYDSQLGDLFTDYNNELYNTVLQGKPKLFSFYRYLKTKNTKLASFYYRKYVAKGESWYSETYKEISDITRNTIKVEFKEF